MVRSVRLEPSGRIYEVNFDVEGELGDSRITHTPSTLRDAFTDLDASIVLVEDKRGHQEPNQAWNANAVALIAPSRSAHLHGIRGDAYVVAEYADKDGYRIIDLPERLGEKDIEDLVKYYLKR